MFHMLIHGFFFFLCYTLITYQRKYLLLENGTKIKWCEKSGEGVINMINTEASNMRGKVILTYA